MSRDGLDRLDVEGIPSGVRRDVSFNEPTDSFGSKRKSAPFFFELRRKARELGLDDIGIVPVGEARTFPVFLERVRKGCCDGLSYLTSDPESRRSPVSVLPDVRTIIVAALSEKQVCQESAETTRSVFEDSALVAGKSDLSGQIVGYATCLDYHDVLKRRLQKLGAFVRERWLDASVRAVVDTAPLLEKDWATAAGLGFCGLHSLVIHRTLGTRFFLGELLVSVPFSEISGFETYEEFLAKVDASRLKEKTKYADSRLAAQSCLSCRRCATACPTNAIKGDQTLDARRCLNFWTIENRREIPSEIAKKLDGKLFGCDLCQQVCPWNADVFHSPERAVGLDAVENLDDATFRRLFKKTPVFRATLEGLRRTGKVLRRNLERSETIQ